MTDRTHDDDRDFVSREEVSEIVRVAMAELVRQITGQTTQDAQQADQTTQEAASVDMSRQISDTAMPTNTQHAIHTNPDPQSSFTAASWTNVKNAGEMPVMVAATINQQAAQLIADTNSFRRKMDDAYATHFLGMCEAERQAVRQNHSRDVTTGTQHDKVIMELDPQQAIAIQAAVEEAIQAASGSASEK